ncbi:MAG: aldehyde dehydrogenase [Ignavibacteria bacterium]|nr:aldehyde dehydrogenase [Ignavibacteria bacterium]
MMKQKFIMNINPSNGEMIEKIKCSSPGEITSAIKLSKKAFKYWSELSLKSRISYFRKVATEIKRRKKDISNLISLEMGKPVKYSQSEVDDLVDNVYFYCELAETAFAKEIYRQGKIKSEVIRNPVGLVAVFTHWNYPVLIPSKIILNAALAGNTVIFKPSDITPLTGKLLYEIFNRNLPKGVVNIIQGADEVTDFLLTCDINMLSFVGTRENGKRILNHSADKLLKIVMELTGKDAMIVLKDANMKQAAKFAVENSLKNCGQDYNSVERIFVESSAENKFISFIMDYVQEYRLGDPFTDVQLGPLATEFQRNIVFSQIEEARRKGARILYGGNKLGRKGYFLEPTVLIDVNEKHDLMKEETFGPVISISRVLNYSVAVERINKLPFGLGVSVWSVNYKKAADICKKIEAGMTSINTSVTGVRGTPYVGIKESGYGYSGGYEAMRFYTNPKKITY